MHRFVLPAVAFAFALVCALQEPGRAQGRAVVPDLAKAAAGDGWKVDNRTVSVIEEDGRKGVRLDERPGSGLVWIEGVDFTDGVIEVDLKGKNVVQRSFLGIAFRVTDRETYDAIYFRPFNFRHENELNRSHGVQQGPQQDSDLPMAIDSYRFLDFATRQIIRAWVGREARRPGPIPWTPVTKPLPACTVALVTTAGVARRDDEPFDQEGERANPWWGDPSYRTIPQEATEGDVRLYHLHIDTRFGEQDLDVVLPMRRLGELAADGVIGRPAAEHYSIMGYQLRPQVLEEETAPAIAREMRAAGVDAAALVPA